MTLALTLYVIDRTSNGSLSHWALPKLHWAISYLAFALDALHGGQETLRGIEVSDADPR